MLTKIDRLLIALVAPVALMAVACGGGETDVRITQPAQGSTVAAGDVTVTVEADTFNVVDRLGQPPEEGEGHVHFYIDVGEIPTVDGEPAVTDEGTYHAVATTEFTWEDVEPGTHTFAVQLVNNDHTPLRPPVIAQVTVEVQEGASGPAPTRSPTQTEEEEEETPEPTEEEEEVTPTRTASPGETATATPRPSPTSTP